MHKKLSWVENLIRQKYTNRLNTNAATDNLLLEAYEVLFFEFFDWLSAINRINNIQVPVANDNIEENVINNLYNISKISM